MSNKAKAVTKKDAGKHELKPKLRFPEFCLAPAWEFQCLAPYIEDRSSRIASDTELPVYTSSRAGLIRQDEYYGGTVRANKNEYGLVPESCFVYRHMSDDGVFAFHINKTGGAIAVSKEYPVFQTVGLHSFFLLYKLNFGSDFKEFAIAQKAGGTRTRLYLSKLCNWETLLPAYDEQEKIADCLSSLDELIAAHSRKLGALKAHKKGLMQQLFPREGETIPRLRFPEFKDAPEWEENTLIDLARFRRGSFPQPYGLPEWYDQENGMPFVQVFDVDDNFRLKPKTKNRISALAAEQSVFIPKETLLVTLQGSIGRVAITQYDAYVDRTLLLFESFRKPIEKIFFAYVIHNLFDIEKGKAPGGIIKTITKEVLSSFIVTLPSLSEQQRIAGALSSLDDLITAQTQKVETLKSHKKALMQQLFPSVEYAQ